MAKYYKRDHHTTQPKSKILLTDAVVIFQIINDLGLSHGQTGIFQSV